MEVNKWGRLNENIVVEISTRDPEEIGLPVEIFIPLPDVANIGDAFFEDEIYPRPRYAAAFDDSIPGWVLSEDALDLAKTEKIAEIDAKTSELIKQGFVYADKHFSMSDAAQRNWTALAAGLANDMLSFPMPVSTVDEATHLLGSANELKAFLAAYLIYQANPDEPLGSGRTLKELVTAAESVEDVGAIVDERE